MRTDLAPGLQAPTESVVVPQSVTPGRVRRMVSWLLRRSRVPCRIFLVVAVAGALGLIGAPAAIAAITAVCIGVLTMVRGPYRSPHRYSKGWSRHLAIAVALMMGVSVTSWSYTGYLVAPGAATFAVRTADWMRDHGLSPVVDQIELRLYGNNEPTNDPVTVSQLPAVVVDGPGFPVQGPFRIDSTAPEPIGSLLDTTLAGEGQWTANTRQVDGNPTTYTTFFRPDPDHLNGVAATVWMDPGTTKLVYVPGTKEPKGEGWAWKSGIPRDERAKLIAAFNAGFKFNDLDGGVFTEGRTPIPLVDGQASLVIYADGRADVGTWGTDLSMTPEVVTVRQNLQLLVDNGLLDPGLSSSIDAEWGKRLWQLQYTRRSGIGITADEALIYVAGSQLTTETLGNALARAGAVRAMELDIHSKQPTFNFFEPAPGSTALVAGTKLLPDMQRDAERYLVPDQRDFFALVLR